MWTAPQHDRAQPRLEAMVYAPEPQSALIIE
jgi:hypothetical protein